MKKHRNIIIFIVAVLVIGIGAYAFVANKKKEESKQNENTQESNTTTDKGDNPPEVEETQQPTTPSNQVTDVSETLPGFNEVSLTVYLNQDATIGPDGKTQIPVGALMPYFYMPSGNFTVQKMVGSEWKDLLTNVSYSGHGGLWAFYTEPTEDNIQYRVLKIENGKPVSVSKIYTVKRSDLTGGVKTYN